MTTYLRAQLAQKVGIHAETLRYYEKIGLLESVTRSTNGYRQYDDQDVARLDFVQKCRALGFTLEEIKTILYVQEQNDYCDDVHALIDQHIKLVQDKMTKLQEILAMLRTLQIQDCGHTAHCGVLQQLQ